MERIDLGQDFTAIVDFAHTPNALKVAAGTGTHDDRRTGDRRLWLGGAARPGEAPLMAEVSAGLADITILTAEDPRTESLEDILAEMAGAAGEKGGVEGKSFSGVPTAARPSAWG